MKSGWAIGEALVQGQCTKQYVLIAAKNVKSPSNPQKEGQFIAENVIKNTEGKIDTAPLYFSNYFHFSHF